MLSRSCTSSASEELPSSKTRDRNRARALDVKSARAEWKLDSISIKSAVAESEFNARTTYSDFIQLRDYDSSTEFDDKENTLEFITRELPLSEGARKRERANMAIELMRSVKLKKISRLNSSPVSCPDDDDGNQDWI